MSLWIRLSDKCMNINVLGDWFAMVGLLHFLTGKTYGKRFRAKLHVTLFTTVFTSSALVQCHIFYLLLQTFGSNVEHFLK